jgi:hypothetical protein
MIELKTSRRQFLAATGMIGLQSVFGRWPAAAQSTPTTVWRRFSFANGSAGMLPCFTDYNLATTDFRFLAEVRPLPAEVQAPGRQRDAFYIHGNNRSDDLFMFLKAALSEADGIVTNQSYLLSFDLLFASKSNNCVGGGEDSV